MNTSKFLILHAVFVCFLFSCSPRQMLVTSHTEQQYAINKSEVQDSSITALLRPYKKGVDTQMDVVLGHTDIPLTKAQPESTLGNFLADATLRAGKNVDPKVEAAVGNYGGIRIPYIAPGAITRGKIYELMPFDNMLTIIEISGSDLLKFCDHIAAYRGWPVSGLRFMIKDKKADSVLINGVPVNTARYYKIAVNDYIANGGDNCDVLKQQKKRNTTVFIRDALIQYLSSLEREGQPLHPVLDQRIRYAD